MSSIKENTSMFTTTTPNTGLVIGPNGSHLQNIGDMVNQCYPNSNCQITFKKINQETIFK